VGSSCSLFGLRVRLGLFSLLAVLGIASGSFVRAEPALLASGAVGRARPLNELLGASTKGAGVISGATRHRLLHFTFDDGPDAQHTPRLLDMLDAAQMKATFFFSTSRFTGKDKRNTHAIPMAREVAQRGHNVGSHSFFHTRMSRLKAPELREQLALSDAGFERVFGANTKTHLFRPPFGSRNAALDAILLERGDATVMWNIGMADWNARTPELIRLTFFRNLERNENERGERGGVVLLHDTHSWSVDAFALIAAELERHNCALLARGEELYDVTEDLAPFAREPERAWLDKRQQALRDRLRPRCASIASSAADPKAL
jgi:peptidoglycan/xylan/chitin deacetylase (PgdA/CDA1 family)